MKLNRSKLKYIKIYVGTGGSATFKLCSRHLHHFMSWVSLIWY